ncbi:DNA polymerase IV [Longispora albida]|uniref:DNA polymerase IV n=1 Tax=Longispora albida TaxID=203523 RepID=UPI00037B79FD|nr:DNA polymerase IV [Longispora albida]
MAGWVLHVDLDQFVAAVEVLRRPELRGRPVVVGGDGDPAKRGVVSTASYEARAFGVHSGMPLRLAARKCPPAVFLPVDRDAYEAASAQVMAVLRETGAVVEVLGWDEAFADPGERDPQELARHIQHGVRAATGLDCTIGIGENKVQAKTATGYGKPAGIFTITSGTWDGLLGGEPVRALWGVGPKTARRLAGLGVTTVGELAAADPAMLAAEFGPQQGPWLIPLARGQDSSPVSGEPYVPRSVSRETTFQEDLADWSQVVAEVDRIARELVIERPAARVVVKVRYAPFTTSTHGYRLAEPSTDPQALAEAAQEALALFEARKPVRLLGVRAEFAGE